MKQPYLSASSLKIAEPTSDLMAARNTAVQIAFSLPKVSNGTLARLRKIDALGPGPEFQAIANRHEDVILQDPEGWMDIIQTIALITSNHPKSLPVHDKHARLGRALACGGDVYTTTMTAPALNEFRFVRLMQSTEDLRGKALMSVLRGMARKFSIRHRVSAGDIAQFCLSAHYTSEFQRQIAQDYFHSSYQLSNNKKKAG